MPSSPLEHLTDQMKPEMNQDMNQTMNPKSTQSDSMTSQSQNHGTGHGAHHEIVRAGAGAGKTYTLTHKVMSLATEMQAREKRWPRLIVTTFTRKATQELRERLMLLALEEHPELVEFINSRSNLVVSTIHGVMDLFLKRYGGKIGIDPSYSVIGPAEAGKLARLVLRDTLLKSDEARACLESFSFNRLVGLFRRLERLILENPDVRAFDFSDFERLFAQEAIHVARELKECAFKIKEESTKADWLAMADDFLTISDLLKGCETPGHWGKRFEELGTRLSAMKTARRNAKAPPVTDQTADEAEILRKRLKEFQEPFSDPRVWTLFSDQYHLLEGFAREFATTFRQEKIANGALEISDLETLAMDCVRRFPETGEAFCAEWDHWLIDEYQDTSPFQVELLRALSGPSPNFIVGDPQQSIYLFRGARSEVFGIKESEILSGGGQQNFLKMNRRSRPELLLFLNDFFTRLDPPFQPMEPFIKEGQALDPTRVVATVFIDPNVEGAMDDDDTGAGNGSGSGAGSGSSSSSGSDRVGDPASVGAIGNREVGGTGETSDDLRQADRELQALVAHVQHLLMNGARFEDICILGRTNKVLTEVATLIGRFHLPTHVHASSGFFDRREIRDALALLKFLVNPHDNFNLLELTRSPWFRVPDSHLVKIAAGKKFESKESLWDGLLKAAAAAGPAEGLDAGSTAGPAAGPNGNSAVRPGTETETPEAISRLRRWTEETRQAGYAETFRRALIAAGFIDLSHRHDVSGRRESNLWKLLSKLQQEEGQAGFNPVSFISAALHDLKVDEANSEGDAVAAVEPDRINLMTVHASKGLEFKHVLFPRMHQKPRLTTNEEFTFHEEARKWAMRIPFGEDGEMTKSLPEVLWIKKFQRQELLEHARVLYVALTRAIDSVFLSWKLPAQVNSWADMVKLDLAPGDHAGIQYTYTVSSSDPILKAPRMIEENVVSVRVPFESEESLDARAHATTSMSVTEILERSAAQGASRTLLAAESATVFATDANSATALVDRQATTHRMKIAAEGTAVHRLMELLKYPSQVRLQQIITKWFPGREDKILRGVEFVRDSQSPPLLEIIKNGFVEWGFAMVHEGILIEGQLDLWGRTSSGEVWIIDYKTGSPEFREKAFAQMELYSIALKKSGQLGDGESIQLAAVFPFAEKIYTRSLDRAKVN